MRRFLRFALRLIGKAIAVNLGLDRLEPDEAKPRSARRVAMETRRD